MNEYLRRQHREFLIGLALLAFVVLVPVLAAVWWWA